MSATLHTNGHLNTMGLPVVDFKHIEQAAVQAARNLKNVALFAAAPFIGLVYAMALPFVGLVMLALVASRAFTKSPAKAAVKNVVLLAAAPFIGHIPIRRKGQLESSVTTQTSSQTSSQNKKGPPKWAFAVVEYHVFIGCGG